MNWLKDHALEIGGVLLVLGLMAVLVAGSIYEQRDWNAFRIRHQCKVVAHIDGDTFNTYSFNAKGQMSVGIATTSDKQGWLCDDGVTYYRSEP